ncbi:hypothetical protein CYMTET_27586 [Cymbomonas tetramitiformis]|uniref:F-box domain-containing protein n=1 Tax=Cymbomonas tetramitiformis TaxID=36881 RepID=A0AAE0FPN2_9CHLO|nr:hypothetical protein CYMTET_27586 [Cymbomonas tetramitiformis]
MAFAVCEKLSDELLELVLRNLTEPQAGRGAGNVCRRWRQICRRLKSTHAFVPLLFCTCSQANRILLLEYTCLSLDHGSSFVPKPSKGKRSRQWSSSRRTSGLYNWPTDVALTSDGAVWVSQYSVSGLVRFEWDQTGSHLEYQRKLEHTELECPEGIAIGFSQCIYVASAKANKVVRVSKDGRKVLDFKECWVHRPHREAPSLIEVPAPAANIEAILLCPWTICIGPDGALYAAAHCNTQDGDEGEDYRRPTLSGALERNPKIDAFPSHALDALRCLPMPSRITVHQRLETKCLHLSTFNRRAPSQGWAALACKSPACALILPQDTPLQCLHLQTPPLDLAPGYPAQNLTAQLQSIATDL